jgi:predicted O-methyltransferase YrrM
LINELDLWGRWAFLRGNSKEILPLLLRKTGTIDMFFHDSEHTYTHMMFEYTAAWKHIRRGGILMSDDVASNLAFLDFSRRVGHTPILFGNVGVIFKK